jgi:hypothetical protein
VTSTSDTRITGTASRRPDEQTREIPLGKKSSQPVKERRAKIEEMRRQQAAAERRKSILFIGVSVIVGLGLIGAAAAPAIMKSINDPSKKPVSSFGVAASAASCDPVAENAAKGTGDHVGPNTQKANITTVKYDTVPPTSGQHYEAPLGPDRKFYLVKDRPKMENLVHNLEHGYTVVWYDATVTGDNLKALENLSEKLGDDPKTRKFIVSAWDEAYGKFPEGKHIGISHWGKDKGYRQLCGQVSGEAIGQFVEKYPQTNAPEPNTA